MSTLIEIMTALTALIYACCKFIEVIRNHK